MKNGEISFWHEPTGERLAGCLGLTIGGFILFCILCLIANYCNRRDPATHETPWLNNDPTRPVTDIKELDYNRRLIIYREEEPSQPLQEFQWLPDNKMYDEPDNYYEDYYEDIYEYFHD